MDITKISSFVYKTPQMNNFQAKEFKKWFDFHIGTIYEQSNPENNAHSFVLSGIINEDEIKKLKNLDIESLGEKERVVFRLKGSKQVYVSKWANAGSAKGVISEISDTLGANNLSFIFDESQYSLHMELNGDTTSEGAIETSNKELICLTSPKPSDTHLTKERAEWLVSNIIYDSIRKTGIGEITEVEKEFVNKVWDSMDGNTSFMTALNRIRLDENFDPSVFYEKIAGGDLVGDYIKDKDVGSNVEIEAK